MRNFGSKLFYVTAIVDLDITQRRIFAHCTMHKMHIYLYRYVHIGRDACSGNCFALNSAHNNICKNMPIPGALLAKHNMEPAA